MIERMPGRLQTQFDRQRRGAGKTQILGNHFWCEMRLMESTAHPRGGTDLTRTRV
jgi:hypothetical protein